MGKNHTGPLFSSFLSFFTPRSPQKISDGKSEKAGSLELRTVQQAQTTKLMVPGGNLFFLVAMLGSAAWIADGRELMQEEPELRRRQDTTVVICLPAYFNR